MPRTNRPRLTEGELAIIQQSLDQNEPNLFTDWFLRSDSTGTYYRPNALTDLWKSRYQALYDHWESLGKPRRFIKEAPDGEQREYQVQFPRLSTKDRPTFFYNHGYRLLPWQNEVYQADKHIILELSGYGAGKTMGVVLMQLFKAATLPGYRAIFCAPQEKQVREAFLAARNAMEKSVYKEKFLIGINNKALKITIGNELVGDFNMLEFYPIGDGVEKIETFTVDDVVIDQADQFDNLQEIRRVIGTRQRGHVRGREIDGHIYFLANSKDGEIWNFHDDLLDEKEDAFVIQSSTYDNIYITDQQLARFEKDVGGTAEAIRIHMKGGRPKGSGEHFPQATQDLMHDKALDQAMKYGLDNNLPGYEYVEGGQKLGVYLWALPRMEGHEYLEICDPGTGNPPGQDSPVILVWDWTNFPMNPAKLVAFSWIFGRGQPDPWMAEFGRLNSKYKPSGTGVDTTGPQSGYPNLLWDMYHIPVTPMPMYLPQKMAYLNTTKTMAGRGLLKTPHITGFYNQITRYKLPDTKLAQDIVAALIMSAGWLAHLLPLEDEDEEHQQSPYEDEFGRVYGTAESRYGSERRW